MIDFRTPTPSAIDEAQATTLAEAGAIVAELVAVPSEERTFANTLGRLEAIDDLLSQASGRYGFMAQVAADAEVRAAADRFREATEKYGVALGFREDLHAAVTAYAATEEAAALTGEDRRLLDRLLRDYRRNGFDLPAAERARVQALRSRLVELGIAFRRNIDTYDDAILVSREGLAGLPPSYIDGLRVEEDGGERRYRVSLAYPEFFPFMDHAADEAARQELLLKSFRKGGEANVSLLEEAIAVRDELARILGYASWAEYVLELRMAQTPAAVRRFLADMGDAIAPKRDRDLADLAAAKRVDTGRPAASLELWDWRYYHQRLRESRYAVDEFAVARYFPLGAVLAGLFDVTGSLLGVRFAPVEPAHAWHEDVRLFQVQEAADGRPLAHFYMDLFPRPNKFGHAAAFTLVGGRRLTDGSYQQPVSAIVANFTKPTETQPSLLRHSEVVTLFHEFGHILHQTLTTAERLRFSGTKTERDFVEAPSQMLEHWVWLPAILRRFSRHVETGEPLPDELIEAMIAAKTLHSGVFLARQLFFGRLDLAYHEAGGEKDTTAIARDLYPTTGFAMPDDTYYQAGFGHLFGYDAGYYGYLWSEVFADDMFSRFAVEGPLNPALGRRYRDTVLAPGGSEDGADLVRSFLGREPDTTAFLRNQGLV